MRKMACIELFIDEMDLVLLSAQEITEFVKKKLTEAGIPLDRGILRQHKHPVARKIVFRWEGEVEDPSPEPS